MKKRTKIPLPILLGVGLAILAAIGLTAWHLRTLNFGPGNPGNRTYGGARRSRITA